MKLQLLSSNVLGIIALYLEKIDIYRLGLVCVALKRSLDRFMDEYSGLKSLENYEISMSVLNQGDFSSEDIEIYTNYLQNNLVVKTILLRIILASKYFIKLGFIAGNAATLLNAANFDFSRYDLSSISIPKANLSNGRFFKTDLSSAHLNWTTFDNSYTTGMNTQDSSLKSSSLLQDRYKGYNTISHILLKPLAFSISDLKIFSEPVKFVATDLYNCMSIVEDSSIIAFGLNKFIHIWLARDCCYKFEAHPDNVSALQLFKSGEFLVSADEGQLIKIWKISDTYFLYHTLIGHTEGITCLDLSPDNELIASASKDKNVKIWDKSRRKVIMTGHTAVVNSVSWNISGKVVISASDDKTIRIWNLNGVCITLINTRTKVMKAFFNESGLIVSGDRLGAVRVSEFDGRTVRFYNSGVGKIINLIESKGMWVIHGKEGIRVVIQTQESFKETAGNVASVVIDQAGVFAYVGYKEGYIKKFNILMNRCEKSVEINEKIQFIALSSGNLCITTCKYEIFVHNYELEFIKSVELPSKIVKSSIENQVLVVITIENEKTFMIIEPISEKCLLSMPICVNTINVHFISRNLIIVCDNQIIFFNIELNNSLQIQMRGIVNSYIFNGYLVVVKDLKLVFYNVNTAAVEFIRIINEVIVDVKTTKSLESMIICTEFHIMLFDQDLLEIARCKLHECGPMFVYEFQIFVVDGRFLISIPFCETPAANNKIFGKKSVICMPE